MKILNCLNYTYLLYLYTYLFLGVCQGVQLSVGVLQSDDRLQGSNPLPLPYVPQGSMESTCWDILLVQTQFLKINNFFYSIVASSSFLPGLHMKIVVYKALKINFKLYGHLYFSF